MQKARRHPSEERLRLLVSIRFQVLFHSPPGVLFTFPSRYLFTIGHRRVFSLRRWSARIHTRFLVSGTTWERIPGPGSAFAYGPITLFGGTFQNLLLADVSTRGDTRSSGFFPQHRQCNARAAFTHCSVWTVPFPLAATGGIEFSFFSSGYLDVSVPRVSLSKPMCSVRRSSGINLSGFPHSEISGSKAVCASPKLIAAYHVLHRLSVPRHPPYALSSFFT